MDKNRANCQKAAWTAEQIAAIWRGFKYLLESVSHERANGLEKRQEKLRKISIARADEAIEDSV